MTNAEIEIAEMILNEGKLLIKKNMKSAEGIEVECYRVKYLGEIYDMTKNNGKWIYFIHL